jgi:hypothetical protein
MVKNSRDMIMYSDEEKKKIVSLTLENTEALIVKSVSF